MTIKNKTLLLASSILVLPFMIGIFYITTRLLGTKSGYFAGFLAYWLYCLSIVAIVFKNGNRKIKEIFNPFLKTRKAVLYSLLAFVPVVVVFVIQFLPNLDSITTGIILLAVINAIINGFVEELYWWGLYLLEYRQNLWIGLWVSSILFGAWHIALYTIRGIIYGGFLPFVGGALFMGFLWSLSARKSDSIVFTILAHMLVNIFAFTGFYMENGF